jgi:hypothetical protein
MEKLLTIRTKNGQPLLWTHVTHLIRVQEVDVREELTQMVVDNDLSPTDLLNMIQKMQGKTSKPASNAGKPMARPKSLRGYIDQQWTLLEQLLKRKNKVWAGKEKKDDKSFFDMIDATPVDKIDVSILTEMEQLQKLYEKVSFELDAFADDLLKIRKRIESEKVKPDEPSNNLEPTDDDLADAEQFENELRKDIEEEITTTRKLLKSEPVL